MEDFSVSKNIRNKNIFISRKKEILEFRKNLDLFDIFVIEGFSGTGKTSLILKFIDIYREKSSINTYFIKFNKRTDIADFAEKFDMKILEDRLNCVVFLNADLCQGIIEFINNTDFLNCKVFFEVSEKFLFTKKDIGHIFLFRIQEFDIQEMREYILRVSGSGFYALLDQVRMQKLFDLSFGFPELMNRILSYILNSEIRLDDLLEKDVFKDISENFSREVFKDGRKFEKDISLMADIEMDMPFSFLFKGKDELLRYLDRNLMLDLRKKYPSLKQIVGAYYRQEISEKDIKKNYSIILEAVFENDLFQCEYIEKIFKMSLFSGKIADFTDFILRNIFPLERYRHEHRRLFDVVENLSKIADHRKKEVEKLRIMIFSYMNYRKDEEFEKDIEKLKGEKEYFVTKALYSMGIHDFSKARILLNKALDSGVDDFENILILYRISNCYIGEHNFSKALENYSVCTDLISEAERKENVISDPSKSFVIDSVKGSIYRSKGLINLIKVNLYDSLMYLNMAEEKLEKVQDMYGLSTTYSMLALCYTRLRRFSETLRYYRKFVRVEKKIGSSNLKILRLTFIIDFYLNRKMPNKALKFNNILQSVIEKGFLTYRYRVVMYNALIKILNGDFEKACEYFTEVIDILKDSSFQLTNLPILFNYAKCLLVIKNTEKSSEIFNIVKEICEKENMELYRALTMYYMGKIYTETRQFYFDIYNEILAGLPAETKRLAQKDVEEYHKYEEQFQNKFPYNITTLQGTRNCDESFYSKIRKNIDKYNFFIDFETLQFIADGKEKDLFRKKNLLRTLIVLLESNGRTICPETIFFRVWGRKMTEKSDKNLLRVTIHSIRKMIPDYVVYDSLNDGYSINGVENYCIIRK